MFGLMLKSKHKKLIERRDRDINILLDEIEDLHAKMRKLHAGELYQIPQHDKYFIDSKGNMFMQLKSYVKKGRITGFHTLISNDGKKSNVSVPKLVYSAFNGISPTETGTVVKFKDGDRSNVSPENLYV